MAGTSSSWVHSTRGQYVTCADRGRIVEGHHKGFVGRRIEGRVAFDGSQVERVLDETVYRGLTWPVVVSHEGLIGWIIPNCWVVDSGILCSWRPEGPNQLPCVRTHLVEVAVLASFDHYLLALTVDSGVGEDDTPRTVPVIEVVGGCLESPIELPRQRVNRQNRVGPQVGSFPYRGVTVGRRLVGGQECCVSLWINCPGTTPSRC